MTIWELVGWRGHFPLVDNIHLCSQPVSQFIMKSWEQHLWQARIVPNTCNQQEVMGHHFCSQIPCTKWSELGWQEDTHYKQQSQVGQTAPRKVELNEGFNNTGQGSLLWGWSLEKASWGRSCSSKGQRSHLNERMCEHEGKEVCWKLRCLGVHKTWGGDLPRVPKKHKGTRRMFVFNEVLPV